jgi:Yip1 domain
MSPLQSQAEGVTASRLSQWQRVANTFTAPSKTFADIQRGNRSWWVPLIILTIVSYALFGAVVQKIGVQQTVENQIRLNPNAEQQLAQLTPEQRARSEKIAADVTEGVFIASPLLTIAGIALLSLGLLGTINFGFGGRAGYGSVIAVWFYAWLPQVIKTLLGIVVIYAGLAPESFNVKNFAPTNVGAFLDPTVTSKALYALAGSVDVVTIWTLVLLGMGVATVAGVKRRSGYLAVFGWWVVFVLVRVIWAALA